MGFSVSGATAIVFAGMIIAFGMFYTATANTMEEVNDARQAASDERLAQQNTDIEIQSAVIDLDQGEMQVTVTNTGTTELGLNATDILVDGGYEAGWQSGARVGSADDTETWVWLPGEELDANVTISSADRVKVVTEGGVADSAEVTST